MQIFRFNRSAQCLIRQCCRFKSSSSNARHYKDLSSKEQESILEEKLREAVKADRKRFAASSSYKPILPIEIRQIFQRKWDEDADIRESIPRYSELDLETMTAEEETENRRKRWLNNIDLLVDVQEFIGDSYKSVGRSSSSTAKNVERSSISSEGTS